jgi:hypothetical protein
MSTLLATLLIVHIVLGLIAVAGVHFAYMQLIRKVPPYRLIEWSSWTAVFLFFISWVTGAYYYVVHYGGAVKPRIVSGDAPWAHTVFMEAKEHIFILIPFLAIVFALVVRSLRAHENPSIKYVAQWIAALILLLGVFVAASGILISGGFR